MSILLQEERIDRLLKKRLDSFKKDLLAEGWQPPPNIPSSGGSVPSATQPPPRDIGDNRGSPQFNVNVQVGDNNQASQHLQVGESSKAPKCSRSLMFKKKKSMAHKKRGNEPLPHLTPGTIQELARDRRKHLG